MHLCQSFKLLLGHFFIPAVCFCCNTIDTKLELPQFMQKADKRQNWCGNVFLQLYVTVYQLRLVATLLGNFKGYLALRAVTSTFNKFILVLTCSVCVLLCISSKLHVSLLSHVNKVKPSCLLMTMQMYAVQTG